MKPFDGGPWVGVTRVADAPELHRRYDESGERLMHLQAAVEDFDVFARSLSIGAETMVMRFEPDRPMHDRYQVAHGFLSPETGDEVVTIGRLVNAFFRWEFNSCETLVKGGEVHPIDYANASPDVAITCLHYYFPWAIKTLVKWCASAPHRPPDADRPEHADYFEVGDREDLSYEEKLAEYRRSPTSTSRSSATRSSARRQLPHSTRRWSSSSRARSSTACSSTRCARRSRPHEHEQFVAHYRGLLAAWARDQRA